MLRQKEVMMLEMQIWQKDFNNNDNNNNNNNNEKKNLFR